jgi:cytochrome c5
MSDPPSTHPPSTRIVPTYLLAYVAVAALIAVVGSYVFRPLHAKTPAAMTPEAIAARLAPVSRLEFASTSSTARTLKDGEAVYAGLCVACHGSGAAGAPKLGDKKAWRPRIAQGLETLIKHATEGYKAMPPKGGGADLDPTEVARAVAWMADQGGASFKEP